uniref:Uncharacterized protein n=1 Tax=Sphaerodactylus townsendi TaxID=933632 RepID=A0ACB8EV44_9SAUR
MCVTFDSSEIRGHGRRCHRPAEICQGCLSVASLRWPRSPLLERADPWIRPPRSKMPPHLSSELASQPKSTNFHFVCCDHLGPKMTKTLPLEASKSPPAGGPDNTAMPPGRVANLMMHWVTKWFRLWQNFPGALMKAILMGIAKGVCRLAAVAPLEKARRPLGEKKELGKDEDGEMLNCEVYHPGYFILSSLESWSQEHVESLIDDRQFGECLEQFSSVAKMGKMDLEDNTALHLIHRSIPFDFEYARVQNLHLMTT